MLQKIKISSKTSPKPSQKVRDSLIIKHDIQLSGSDN